MGYRLSFPVKHLGAGTRDTGYRAGNAEPRSHKPGIFSLRFMEWIRICSPQVCDCSGLSAWSTVYCTYILGRSVVWSDVDYCQPCHAIEHALTSSYFEGVLAVTLSKYDAAPEEKNNGRQLK